MTYMFILKCALKLVLKKNILYYDARSEKHKKKTSKKVSYFSVIISSSPTTKKLSDSTNDIAVR